MSKVLSSVLKPFAKLTGAMPSAQRIPEGYEAVKTGTEASYMRGGGRDDPVETISQARYDKLVTADDARPDFSSYGDFGQGQGGSGGASPRLPLAASSQRLRRNLTRQQPQPCRK